jgi:hypothetical protein
MPTTKVSSNLVVTTTNFTFHSLTITNALSLGTSGNLIVSSTTSATSTTTGALRIVGGAGIGGNTWIGGILNVAGGITGTITGNASTADRWSTARTITLGGDLSGSVNIDGSSNVTLTATVAANSVALGTDTTGNYVATGATSGFGLSGSATDEGSTFTVTANSTSANTVSTIVFRDGSGNFSAGTITGSLSGTASAATNIAGGAAGQVHYQSGVGVTAFTAAGSSGQLLQSNGTGAPTWITPGGLSAGSATTASQINTVLQTANASYFPTFVDANNSSAAAELLHTTSSFVINPATGNVGIGTTSPSFKLDVSGSGTRTVRSVTTDTSGAAVGRFRAVYTGGGGGAASAVDLRAGDGYTYLLNETSTPLLFGTNNTERMRIDSSGNVGIGTTGPSGNLQVSAANTRVRFSNTAGTASTLLFGADSGSTFLGAETNAPIYFITNNTERMRIDASGNILIGTANTGAEGLGIASTLNLTFAEGSGNSYANLFRQQSSAATILANGYKRSATANSFASSVGTSWAKTAIGLGVSAGSITFYTDPAGTVANGTNVAPTERMRIDSSGQVGIGITPPTNTTSRLYVNSDLTLVGTNRSLLGNLYYDTAWRYAANGFGWGFREDSAGKLQLASAPNNTGGVGVAASVSFPVTFDLATGNVGIGTTPSHKLDVYGGSLGTTSSNRIIAERLRVASSNDDSLEISKIRDASGSDWNTAGWRLQQKIDSTWMGWMQFNGNGNAEGISFGTGSSTVGPLSISEKMRINASGNVGIGRSPSVKLDVDGVIYSRYTAAAGVAGIFALDGYAQFGKSPGNRMDIINSGGLDANSPFWIGYQWTPPDTITNSSSQISSPRTSFYFNYSTATNPSNMAWNMYVGNNNGIPIGVNIGTETAGNINLITNGQTRLTVNSNGAVGFNSNFGSSGQVLTSNGTGSVPSWQTVSGMPGLTIVTGTTQAAVAGTHYAMTNASASTLTLPASPSAGDTVWITFTNNLITNIVARNGQNIMGLAEDMTADNPNATIQLRFINSTVGWRLI